ncbi:hypothetical protein ACHAWF_003394, partial [Thalassiosira exigua]
EFLPAFYEAVLELLARERARSREVFGPDLAPSIVVRVLAECFRPIEGSFAGRLGSVCPAPGRGGSGGMGAGGEGGGGTEALAATYEATVRFLSAAYDHVEPWNAPPATATTRGGGGEGSSSGERGEGGDGDCDVLRAMREAVLLVAAPYRPYQADLARAERDPLGAAAAAVARDVRGVAVEVEDAAGRLEGLAPFVFPLAEGEFCVLGCGMYCRVWIQSGTKVLLSASRWNWHVRWTLKACHHFFCFPSYHHPAAIRRFELLNSGYNAPATLSSIDGLISNHASELAIAMGTLSTNASSSGSKGAGPEFDERQVNCALEILRIAGTFKRNLRSFERSVRERLRVLSREMEDAALDGDTGGAVPDELSPTQIRALLAREACSPDPKLADDGTGVKRPATVVELRRLAGPSGPEPPGGSQPPLFPGAVDAASRLARSCLSFVFEVCYAVPEGQLRGISALPVWKQEGDGAGDDEAASYGMLPQPFITHVGEHVLALVQALEPFASDPEALGLANEVMSGVMEVAVQPWKEFVAAAGCSFSGDEKSQLEVLMKGKDISKYLLDDDNEDEVDENNAEEHEEEEEEEDPDAKASAAFCNQWLDVVGLAVTGRLLERAMRIPRLGRKGAEHLATDLNYVRNVFAALGVSGHPHPLLGYVAGLVTLDEGALKAKISQRKQEGGDGYAGTTGALEVIKRAELRIAYVRSISV